MGLEVVKSNAQESVELGKFYGNAAVFKEHFIKQGVIQARYLPLLVFSIAYGIAFLNAIFLYQQDALDFRASGWLHGPIWHVALPHLYFHLLV